jgi:hypothetical protein
VEREYVGITFAHLSVAEFLKSTMPDLFSGPKSHAVAAVSCLLLVNPGGLLLNPHPAATSSDAVPSNLQWAKTAPSDKVTKTAPLLEDYASRYWPVHCRKAENTIRLQEIIPPSSNLTLHQIIRNNDSDALRATIAAKADLESVDPDGNTALHKAVEFNDTESLRILILAGANYNTSNHLGQSPLHAASFTNDVNCLRLLVVAGGNKNSQDFMGSTPLHYAVYHGNAEALRYLSATGAQKDLKDQCGMSAIDFCSKFVRKNELINEMAYSKRAHEVSGSSLRDGQKLVVSGHLCSYCNITQWIEAPATDKTPHWSSLTTLKVSADTGCELCKVLLQGFVCQPEVHDHWHDTQIWTKISQGYSSIEGRDAIVASLGSIATYEVELCEGPGPPLLFKFMGIEVGARSDSPRTFSKLQSWMESCESSHDDCKVIPQSRAYRRG